MFLSCGRKKTWRFTSHREEGHQPHREVGSSVVAGASKDDNKKNITELNPPKHIQNIIKLTQNNGQNRGTPTVVRRGHLTSTHWPAAPVQQQPTASSSSSSKQTIFLFFKLTPDTPTTTSSAPYKQCPMAISKRVLVLQMPQHWKEVEEWEIMPKMLGEICSEKWCY